jgi:hypothetical protein
MHHTSSQTHWSDCPPSPLCPPAAAAADLSAACLLTKECWNKLVVPVDTSKVAHGDANLDIRDFLAVVS